MQGIHLFSKSASRHQTGSAQETDRGVSEVLGFTFTLALVIVSVSLVFGLGVTSLENVQSAQQAENAEGAFTHIATKFADLGVNGAPYRAGELSVTPGTVGVADSVTVTVTVTTSSGNHSDTFDVGALSYTQKGTRLSLEAGGLVRNDRGASVMLRNPDFSCGATRAIVPLHTLNDTEGTSRSADVVTVTGRYDSTTLWYPFNRTGTDSASDATAVTVEVNSPNEAAWNRYFENADGWVDPDGDGAFTCTTDRVFVRQIDIDVTLV